MKEGRDRGRGGEREADTLLSADLMQLDPTTDHDLSRNLVGYLTEPPRCPKEVHF